MGKGDGDRGWGMGDDTERKNSNMRQRGTRTRAVPREKKQGPASAPRKGFAGMAYMPPKTDRLMRYGCPPASLRISVSPNEYAAKCIPIRMIPGMIRPCTASAVTDGVTTSQLGMNGTMENAADAVEVR